MNSTHNTSISTTNDPISDMLTRIRNAQAVRKETVALPFSQIKMNVAEILKKNGYVADVKKIGEKPKYTLEITLKYTSDGQLGHITSIIRVSKPGRRVYKAASDLRPKRLGFEVLSTSQGIMTDRDAKKQKLGGEVLCAVR